MRPQRPPWQRPGTRADDPYESGMDYFRQSRSPDDFVEDEEYGRSHDERAYHIGHDHAGQRRYASDRAYQSGFYGRDPERGNRRRHSEDYGDDKWHPSRY